MSDDSGRAGWAPVGEATATLGTARYGILVVLPPAEGVGGPLMRRR